jgi:hypothetical protein
MVCDQTRHDTLKTEGMTIYLSIYLGLLVNVPRWPLYPLYIYSFNVLRLFLRICKNSNEITILLSKYPYLCIFMFDFFFKDNYIGYFKKTSCEKLLNEFSVPLNSLIILISIKIIWNSYIILSMNLISINPFYKWIDRHSLSKN